MPELPKGRGVACVYCLQYGKTDDETVDKMEVSLTKDGELIIKAKNSVEVADLIAWGEDFFNKKSGTLSILLSVNFDHTIPKKENYFFTITNSMAE